MPSCRARFLTASPSGTASMSIKGIAKLGILVLESAAEAGKAFSTTIRIKTNLAFMGVEKSRSDAIEMAKWWVSAPAFRHGFEFKTLRLADLQTAAFNRRRESSPTPR